MKMFFMGLLRLAIYLLIVLFAAIAICVLLSLPDIIGALIFG
jgi:hypothetical protein